MRLHELNLNERLTDDPDITGFDEVPVKKTEPEGEIDAVIAHLKGHRSAFFTKLARRFDRANRIKKMLNAEEKKLKKQALGAIDEIFDASDAVYTRVVETASLVFKIAKSGESTVATMDDAGYLAELEKLSGLAVEELKVIREKYVGETVKKVLPKVLAPKEKKPAKESMNEGAMDQISRFASLVTKKVAAFLSQWDRQFDNLKSKIESQL